jgi:uncharacterized protein YjbJ (UPF0337 family)
MFQGDGTNPPFNPSDDSSQSSSRYTPKRYGSLLAVEADSPKPKFRILHHKKLVMNWDRIKGEWKQRRGKAVNQWGKMMNDEIAAIAGELQEKLGSASEEAKCHVDGFKNNWLSS